MFILESTGGYARVLAPGLNYQQFECTVDGTTLFFHKVQIARNAGLELRALQNNSAREHPQCPGHYSGASLQELVLQIQGLEGLAAINGLFFHPVNESGVRPGHRRFMSNGLIWSHTDDKPGGVLLEPLQLRGGRRFFVYDNEGGHQVTIGPHSQTSDAVVHEIRHAYPQAMLVLQMNMNLMEGFLDQTGRLVVSTRRGQTIPHYTSCIPDQSPRWTCNRAPRSALCVRNGQVSLIATPSRALAYELAIGLRRGGSCETQCDLLYLLDGGGSTQLGWRDPETHRFRVVVGQYGHQVRPPCADPRPVENLIVVGRPWASTTR